MPSAHKNGALNPIERAKPNDTTEKVTPARSTGRWLWIDAAEFHGLRYAPDAQHVGSDTHGDIAVQFDF
jgi:hypothetical protein